jgi:hypothetical protein
MKLKKGSAAAKAYMAKIRAKKGTAKKVAVKKTTTKKVGNTLKFEDGYFKVLGKKNGQLVEITENPLNYIDAKKFIKEQGIEKYYTNVDIVPYRGNKKPVKYIGSTLKLHKKETRLGMPPKTKSKSGNGYHKDTKSHNVNIRVVSGVKESEINFGVYVKGKRALITKSPTMAISEAKFYSIAFNSIAIIKSGNSIFAKYKNGKKI